jgi:glutamate-1-semialdehyde 2,1-aminomutase
MAAIYTSDRISMNETNAERLYQRAQQHLPGGVSASARMNPAIGRPFYIRRGNGAYVEDLNGQRYVDMCMSHGASLLGHNHPTIVRAVQQALELGIVCAYETEYQIELAERLAERIPCAEQSRFAGSGSEAMMHALRLARAATGRELIIKFEGHFHGYADVLNYSWAPPLAQAGTHDHPTTYPESAGMPATLAETVMVVPFNDPAALEQIFTTYGEQIAALLLEPVNYDSGCILPAPGFLQHCRTLCDRYGTILLFDEVLTAFRMHPAGAQGWSGIIPDLAVLGKALGAGMPISAIVGRRAVMRHLRPEGSSELSGTYLAHLTAVLAAQAAIDTYAAPGFYDRLGQIGHQFYTNFQRLIDRSGVPLRLQYVGARFGLYFGVSTPVTNYREAALQDRAMLKTFIAGCIARGTYFHLAAHHGFSAAHNEAAIDCALNAIDGALDDVRRIHV